MSSKPQEAASRPGDVLVRARRSLDAAIRQERIARAELEAAMVAASETGLSQSEIAHCTAVSQPYVSQVLTRCRGRFVPRSRLGHVLTAHRRDVLAAAHRHGASDVTVFGSVARGDDDDQSDIDLAVTVPDEMGLIGLARLEVEIESILGVDVDLVPLDLLTDSVRATAAVDAVPL